MGDGKDLLENLSLELRRGTLTLCVLSQMAEKKYGYALVQSLEGKGVPIDPNTLYPLLRRLEGRAAGRPTAPNPANTTAGPRTGTRSTGS